MRLIPDGIPLLAERYVTWASPLDRQGWVTLIAVSVLLWCVVRFFWGRSLVDGKLGLILLRIAALAILIAILMGPTIIDEQDGDVSRPSMMLLFDGSQSMQLGGERNRWETAVQFVGQAQEEAGREHRGDVQAFRFGHRLSPLISDQEDLVGPLAQRDGQEDPAETGVTLVSGGDNVQTADASGQSAANGIAGPDASDSRLADALRQLLPQVNAKSSAGVVLLSDGRVRASESVERLSEIFGQAGVPIHVVPIGQAGGSGDVAIVSLVVPSRVRKYTENELQVFLRSFGYAGKQTTVRIKRKDSSGGEDTTVASLPITLAGGSQSASLTFRVDERPEDFVVCVDPVEGELTTRNNQVEARVEIDRTKVRVLCIQDGQVSQSQSFLSQFLPFSSSSGGSAGGSISIQSALQADEDVECTLLLSLGGQSLRRVTSDNASPTSAGFPKTRAELFAYDCVIFANVTPEVLDEEQQQWLSQWIDGRGGGLVLTGPMALKSEGWQDSPLADLLPVTLDTGNASLMGVATAVDVVMPNHPVWRLRMEAGLNQQLLRSLPELSVAGFELKPRASASVLAASAEDQSPVMLTQRAGRGRVLVSKASLSGSDLVRLADSWGDQPERVAGKLWRNIVYWATEESSTGRRRLVVQSNQRFYRPGQQVSLRATAYDEAARRTLQYRIWAMFEPESLDDMSLYSPVLWPDNVVRESGEVGPRIAWGEELPLKANPDEGVYQMQLMLSEAAGAGDSGMRIELTAYEGQESPNAFSHGTQVDSTSLAIQILSDPFEQQNPLPNHELMARVASVSGGQVIDSPADLGRLLRDRKQFRGPPTIQSTPAWNRSWLWLGLIGLLSTEWVWRRISGLA